MQANRALMRGLAACLGFWLRSSWALPSQLAYGHCLRLQHWTVINMTAMKIMTGTATTIDHM
jgi:hypothetical protein